MLSTNSACCYGISFYVHVFCELPPSEIMRAQVYSQRYFCPRLADLIGSDDFGVHI